MADEQIDLSPATPEQIDVGNVKDANNFAVLPDAIDGRAFKAFYGSVGTPAAKPMQDFKDNISQGYEKETRQEVASTLNEQLANKRYDLVAQTLANRDTPLGPEDLTAISSIYSRYYNPDNVFEQNYATNYIASLDKFAQKQGDESFWNVAKRESLTDVQAAQQYGTLSMAQRGVAERLREGVQSKIANQTMSGWGNYGHEMATAADYAKMMVPFSPYYEYYMRGNVPGVGFFEGGDLGSHLEKTRAKLRSLPFDQYTETLTNITNNLSSFNPHLADAFLEKMIAQTSTDKALDTINTFAHVADAAILFKFGLGVSKAMRAVPATPEVAGVREAVKDVLKAADGDPTVTNITAAVGDMKESAASRSTENITNRLTGASNGAEEAIDALPMHLRLDRLNEKANPGVLSTTLSNIIEQDSINFEKNLMGTLENTLRPQRIPMQRISRDGVDAILKEAGDKYPSMSNSIIKIADPVYDPFSTTYEIPHMWVGKRAGEMFGSINEAKQYMRAHGLSEAQATPKRVQGAGHVIEIKGIKLDETGDVIRDYIVRPDIPESISPSLRQDDALLSRYVPFFDYLRTPEDTLSAEQRVNRKAATFPQAEFRRVAVEEAELIRDLARGVTRFDANGDPIPFYKRYFPGLSGYLKKNQWNDFKRMLDLARDDVDPLTGNKGYFAQHPAELQQKYMTNLGRIPSFEEQRAYFANKRLVEYDRVLRTVGMYRNKARVGAENFEVISSSSPAPGMGHNGGPVMEEASKGEVRSIPFDGVRKNYLPSKGNILIMGEDVHGSRVHSLEHTHPKLSDAWKADVESGKATLVEVYDPESRPFSNFVEGGNRYIRYVLTKTMESKPLSYIDQVNRLGGGHFVWDYDHYIKQAKVFTETVNDHITYRYEGDRTIMPVSNRSEGRQFSRLLNDIRLLLKDGKSEEAAVLGQKLPPPMSFDEFKAGFSPSRDEKGTMHPPRYNYDEPFQIVPKGRSIIDIDNTVKNRYPPSNWKDGTREGLARNFQVEFTQQRDSYDMLGPVVNKGTINNPDWNIEPGRMIDPIKTANRALNKIISSTTMEDYKASAVEAWLREAEVHLDATPAEIRASPYHYFYNPEFLKGTPPEIRYPLMANRFKIRQMTGIPNVLEGYLFSTMQALYDAAYTMPQGAAAKLANPGATVAGAAGRALTVLDPIWKITQLKDPVRTIRTLTFDALMGMFSIPQFFVQQGTWVNVAAISPRSAPAAVMGALFQQWTRHNKTPETLKMLDDIAVRMGSFFPGMRKYKPGELTESITLLDRSGWGHVGGEFSMIDNNRVANVIQNGADRFMDWSRFFFREGERSPRYGAWHTAYLEYREKNPTGPISPTDANKILDRADFLNNNMSIASHSATHTGPVSLITQFYAYQIRMTEVLTSKRLAGGLGDTPTERTLARSRLILANMAMFGIPAASGISLLPISDWLRGMAIERGYKPGDNDALTIAFEGIPSFAIAQATGKYYNIGNRYGQQGLSLLKDLANSDGNFWKIVGGASANVTMNTFGPNKDGLVDALTALARGDMDKYPPKWQDVLKFFQEVKSVSSTQALWIALNSGEWVNRNKDRIEDVSATEAFARYIFGIKGQDEADVWTKGLVLKARDDLEKVALKRFHEEMNLSLMAQKNGDKQAAQDHYSRAVAPLIATKMEPDKIAVAISRVVAETRSLIDTTNFKFYIDKAPADVRTQMRKVYETIPQKGSRF